MNNYEPLINRQTLKEAMKAQKITYSQAANFLGITPTGFAFKISGRKARGITPFNEREIQVLRALFGDSIFNPIPKGEKAERKELIQ